MKIVLRENTLHNIRRYRRRKSMVPGIVTIPRRIAIYPFTIAQRLWEDLKHNLKWAIPIIAFYLLIHDSKDMSEELYMLTHPWMFIVDIFSFSALGWVLFSGFILMLITAYLKTSTGGQKRKTTYTNSSNYDETHL